MAYTGNLKGCGAAFTAAPRWRACALHPIVRRSNYCEPVSLVRIFSLTILMIWAGACWAPPKILPPSEAVCAPGRHLVSAQATARNIKAETMTLTLAETLCGTPLSGTLEVRLAEHLLTRVPEDTPLLVSVITHRKIHGNPDLQPEPQGPQVTREQGVSPAVLSDRPEIRAVLAGPTDDHDAFLALLFPLLAQADPQLTELAVAELTLRPELIGALNASQREILLNLARSADTPPGAKRELLTAKQSSGEALLGDAVQAVSADLLENLPLTLDAASEYPSLVLTAIHLFQGPATDPKLTRWAACEHPGVLDRVLTRMVREAPQRASELISVQQARALIPPEMRRTLARHQRRLN